LGFGGETPPFLTRNSRFSTIALAEVEERERRRAVTSHNLTKFYFELSPPSFVGLRRRNSTIFNPKLEILHHSFSGGGGTRAKAGCYKPQLNKVLA
jgi:hypothetical protein